MSGSVAAAPEPPGAAWLMACRHLRTAARDDLHAMPVLLETTLPSICSNVVVRFAVLFMKQPLKLNDFWAALCICGAVYFVFRES